MVDFRSIAHGYESPSEWIREPGITDEQSQVRQAIFDAARWRALTNVARNYPGRVRHAFQQRIKDLQKQGDREKATKMRDEFALLEPCLAAGKQVATGAQADPRGIWGLVQSITFRILQNVGKDRLPEAQQGIRRGKTDYRLDDVWDPDETYCAVELPTTLQHELRKTRMLPARRAVAGPGYPGADHHHSYPFNFRWNVVVDPTPSSEMVDIFFRATFADLANMIRGGLDPVRENLTLFTNWHDARAEAERRFADRQNTTAGGRRPGAGIDLLQFIQLSKELQDLGWAVQTFLPDQLLTLLHREADWPDLKPEALRKMLRVLRALQRAGIAGADEAHDTIQTYLRIRSGGEPSSSQTLGLYTGGYEASGPGAGIDLLHFIRLYREMQSLGWAVQEQLEKLVRQEADFDDLNPNALRMMLPVLRSLQRAGVADADETHDAIKNYLENPDAYNQRDDEDYDEDNEDRTVPPPRPGFYTSGYIGGPRPKATDYHDGSPELRPFTKEDWWAYSGITELPGGQAPHIYHGKNATIIVGGSDQNPNAATVYVEQYDKSNAVRLYTKQFSNLDTAVSTAQTLARADAKNLSLRSYMGTGWTHDRLDTSGYTSGPRTEEPKITQPTLVRVHGWVMLDRIDEGVYRVEPSQPHVGRATYNFYRPKGRRPIARHFAGSVDSWIHPAGHPDLNYIEIIGTANSAGHTGGPNGDEDLWMADVAEKVTAARAKDPQHYVPTYVRIPGRDRPETILYAGNPAAIVWDITRPHPRQGYPSLRTAMGRLNLFANRVAVFSDKRFMAKYDTARDILQRLYATGELQIHQRDQLRSHIPPQMLAAMDTQQRRRERGEPRGRENPAGDLSLRLVAPALRVVAGYLGHNSY